MVSRRALEEHRRAEKGSSKVREAVYQSLPSRLESEHPPECTVKTFRVPSMLCADPMTCDQHLAPSKMQSIPQSMEVLNASVSALSARPFRHCASHDVLSDRNDRSSEMLTSIDPNTSLMCSVRKVTPCHQMP